jgi:hypothetical protein
MAASWRVALKLRRVQRATRPSHDGQYRPSSDQAAIAAAVAAARHLLHLPKPGRRASGLPSPVLKFAWQRRQTYILELDIIGLTPGSPAGRAATYSAWVWRSFWLLSDVAGEEGRRLAIDGSLKKSTDGRVARVANTVNPSIVPAFRIPRIGQYRNRSGDCVSGRQRAVRWPLRSRSSAAAGTSIRPGASDLSAVENLAASPATATRRLAAPRFAAAKR